MKIRLLLPNGTEKNMDCSGEVYADQLAEMVRGTLEHQVYACRMNRKTLPLHTLIEEDCTLELLDLEDESAYRIYCASVNFLYTAAVKELYGASTRVVFENGLSGGVYTTIRTQGIDQESSELIEEKMRELGALDEPFIETVLNREELIAYMKENRLTKELRLILSAEDIQFGKIYRYRDMAELCYNDMVPSAGYLKYFDIKRYKNGMLVRYPLQEQPEKLPTYREDRLVYGAFAENTRWGRTAGIVNAADLNEKVHNGEMGDLILLCEALQEKRIADIAAQIVENGKRFILIAGPSSSGKTSFAKRLCIQLRVLGKKPLYLGTDDFFLERTQTPLLPNGEKDYESIRALDLELFSLQMNALLRGEVVDLPTFDFKEGTKRYGDRLESVGDGEPIVIEGIHGLNPLMTESIDEEQKFRIYISPLTQLNIDEHNRIFTSDARMLRRMVRDFRFRNYSAEHTILSWDKVRAGEEVNIFPYTDEADVFFNSHLLYELAVLKKYAKPLLEELTPESEAYPEAQRLLKYLEFYEAMEDDRFIPNNSIMREFIGGSVLV